MAYTKEASQLRSAEMADNPSPRVPICLALDVSGSMQGEKIQELNRAIAMFLRAIEADEIASLSAEVAMVTFGHDVRQIAEFTTIRGATPPTLQAGGATPLGAAVMASLDLLDQAKKIYSKVGVDYYQPWLVIITDGQPTDNITAAAERCCKMVNERKLTVFPIGIGRDADLRALALFSPKSAPIQIGPEGLPVFFEWLSKSTAKVSVSTPGDQSSNDIGAEGFAKNRSSWQDAFGVRP